MSKIYPDPYFFRGESIVEDLKNSFGCDTSRRTYGTRQGSILAFIMAESPMSWLTVSKSYYSKRSNYILERSFEDDEYNEDEIVLTSFELEYEIEIQKRFRQLQKIFADKKAELARIAQAGFQEIAD